VALGNNLILNGDFDTNIANWLGNASGVQIDLMEWSAGRLHANSTATNQWVAQAIPLVTGKAYHVVLSLQVVRGNVITQWSTAVGMTTVTKGVGSHILAIDFISTVTGNRFFLTSSPNADGAEWYLDQVSIRENTMALASVGWEMTVTLADNGGGLSNLNYQLVAAAAADAATAGGTIRTALAAVTGMSIMSYTLTERFVDAVAVLPGDDGVQRENRAKLNCVLDSGLKAETIYIPAPVIGIFEGTSGDAADRVDIADADLVTYLEIWKVTGALAKLSDGEYLRDLLPCRSGIRTHRRSSFG
jgi:hypothetical protein